MAKSVDDSENVDACVERLAKFIRENACKPDPPMVMHPASLQYFYDAGLVGDKDVDADLLAQLERGAFRSNPL